MAARQDPGAPARAIDGDDDVVKSEGEIGKLPIVAGRHRQPLEMAGQLVAEAADHAALERGQRRIGLQ